MTEISSKLEVFEFSGGGRSPLLLGVTCDLTGLFSLLGPSGFWQQALPVGFAVSCNNNNLGGLANTGHCLQETIDSSVENEATSSENDHGGQVSLQRT